MYSFMYMIEKNRFPGEFLSSFLVNIIVILSKFDSNRHFQNECAIWDDKRIQFLNNQLINIIKRGTLNLARM